MDGMIAHNPVHHQHGFTLLELLVSMAVLGIFIGGLHQTLSVGMTTYGAVDQKQALLAEGRYALQRITRFVAAADAIASPNSGAGTDTLTVSERCLDIYDNGDGSYAAAGDGFLDADTDGDRLVNEDEGSGDVAEWATFALDKTDSDNWLLTETRPDYTTTAVNDKTPATVICNHVTVFSCRLAAPNLVEIALAIDNGHQALSLNTRVYVRHAD